MRGISSMATRHLLAELADAYQRQSRHRIAIESVGGVDAERRIQGGEAFDWVVLSSDAIDRLAGARHVDPLSRVDLARSGVAIAVKAGAPKPDVGNESVLRDAILAARSVGYSTGPSGVHLARLFERWGIAQAIAPRIVQPAPGVPIGALIARGEVELGFQQLSELIHADGVDIVGPLPAQIQLVTVFSGAVCASSSCRTRAEALLSFLASADADAAKHRHGMEPARSAE